MALLAKAASKITQEQVVKATLALGSIELLATGALGVVYLTTRVAKSIDEVGNTAMLEALGYAAGIITATGAMAFAAGALVFGPQALLFAAGVGALATVDLLIAGTSATMMKVAEAANVTKDLSEEDINSFTGTFNTVIDNFAGMIGLRFMAKLAIITANTPMLSVVSMSMATVAGNLSKIALISGPNGTLRGVTIDKDGNFVYSDYVDVKSSVISISDSIKIFVDTISDTFKKIAFSDIIKSGIGMEVLGKMMTPVSLFAKTMLSFQDAGKGKIREIRYKKDGTLVDTQPVDVESVSKIISQSISIFASTLFSEENQKVWKRITEGEKDEYGTTTMVYAEKAMGILATIISPVCEFANTLSQFGMSNGSIITIPVYNEKGVITNVKIVDVVNVANAIANSVSKFASTLFSNLSLIHI